MSDVQLKALIYLSLTASVLLAILVVFYPDLPVLRASAALCLWGCGILVGMSWQLLIDHSLDAAQSDVQTKED